MTNLHEEICKDNRAAKIWHPMVPVCVCLSHLPLCPPPPLEDPGKCLQQAGDNMQSNIEPSQQAIILTRKEQVLISICNACICVFPKLSNSMPGTVISGVDFNPWYGDPSQPRLLRGS